MSEQGSIVSRPVARAPRLGLVERAPGPARRRSPRAHPSRPTASSRRPPSTYGFNSDDESSPDAGSCPYSHGGPLAASGVSHPPEHYTVTQFLYATCDPRRLGQSPESYVQVGERGVVRAAQGRSDQGQSQTNWIGHVAVATDEGAAARTRQARHRRGVARCHTLR
jgi:hypothetical protein